MSCKLVGKIITDGSLSGEIKSTELAGAILDESRYVGHIIDKSDYSGRISSVFLDLKGHIEDSVLVGHISC